MSLNKQALLNFLAEEIASCDIIGNDSDKAIAWECKRIIKRINAGLFDAPSDNHHLRVALEQILVVMEDSPVKTYQRMEDIARQTLSGSSEPIHQAMSRIGKGIAKSNTRADQMRT